jgi:endonuclease/exonuclease/phosphatase family metal-dependent hydrolase
MGAKTDIAARGDVGRSSRDLHPHRRWRHGALAAALAVSGPAVAGESLHVVGLNAWGLPAPLAPDRRARLEATSAWLGAVDPDLVALQELWSGAVPHLRRAVVRSAGRGDDGLALGGRAQLTAVTTLRFARARGFDALKQKGALRGWSAAHGVWLVSTHLQSGRGRANAGVRRHQLDELVAWLARLEAPVVLVGDLNLEGDDPTDLASAAALAAAGWTDVALALDVAHPTYPGNGARYDRVLVRDGDTHRLVPEHAEVVAWGTAAVPVRLSDHHAVSARLRRVPRDAVTGPAPAPRAADGP